MYKYKLLNQLYSKSKYDRLTISDFMALAHFYNVNIECYVGTPVYSYKITKDICYELNRLYKEMTCRNLYSGKLTIRELNSKFNEINSIIVFK